MPLGQAAELAPESGKVLANLALLLLVEGEPVRAQHVMDRAKLGEMCIRDSNSITPDGFPAPLGFSKSAALASGFSLFYDSNDFSARLRLLQNNGMARVLAEPTLVALSLIHI